LHAVSKIVKSSRAVQDFASLRNNPYGMATDGTYIWTANNSGSVSKVSLVGTNQTFTNGFIHPIGVLFDGSNIWVTDQGGFGSLDKLDGNGNKSSKSSLAISPVASRR